MMRHGAPTSASPWRGADYRVHILADVLEEEDGPMLRHGLQAVHGSKIVLPRRVEDHPNRDYLSEQFERFRAF
jgi:putative restriction endonuclease